MKFIQMLNEASSLQLGDLKKALKKDNKVNAILSKSSTFDSIEDKKAFVSSIKYWIFNNENVRNFVRQRESTGKVNKWDFDSLKKIKPNELDETTFQSMKDFVSDLFRDVTAVSNLSVSASTKKEIVDFVNSNRGYHSMSSFAQKELASIPGLKPTKPIVLYRGLLFSEHSLQTRKSYDGTLDKGAGVRFLESVRKGSKIVDLKWDRPSSWSTSKTIATRFAKYGPASSSFAATMQWLSRESKKKEIDGALGFVISTRMQPEDILLDVQKLYGKLDMAHGDEGEVIVKPGTYTCKIVHKYTPSGEVEVDANDDSKSETLQAIVEQLLKIEKLIPDEFADAVGDHYLYNYFISMRDQTVAKKLATNGATTAALHAFEKTIPLLKSALIDFDQLDVSHFAHSDEASRMFTLIKDINKSISTPETIMVGSEKKKISPMNMTAEQFRNSSSWPDLARFEREYLTGGRITSQDAASIITGAAKLVGVDTPSPGQFKQFGAVKQEALILEVMKKFIGYLGVSVPEDKMEVSKTFVNLLRKIHRNRSVFYFLASIDKKLKELKQPADINTDESR